MISYALLSRLAYQDMFPREVHPAFLMEMKESAGLKKNHDLIFYHLQISHVTFFTMVFYVFLSSRRKSSLKTDERHLYDPSIEGLYL